MGKEQFVSLTNLWLGTLLVLACLGCGKSEQRVMLQGSVTVDGKPVERGIIRFVRQDGGPVNAVEVKDGRYNTADLKERQGLLPGTHRVEIQVFERIKSDADVLLPEGVTPQKIVVKHEEDLVVQDSGDNRHDLQLTSRGGHR